MKKFTVFFLAFVVTTSTLAGCTSGGLPGPVKTTVPTPYVTTTVVVEIPETTTAIPVTTAPQTTTTTTVTTTGLVTADDVRDHFLAIAYYPSHRLDRIDYSSRIVISTATASDDDITLIERTAKDFNDASKTVKLSENVKKTEKGDIIIKFLPEEGLRAVDFRDTPESGPFSEALANGELYQGSIPAAKIGWGTIYINANLKGDARKHVIVRSLLYVMGLTGETTKYPDSIFYAQENSNVNLVPVDKKAIAILYEPGLWSGMTAEDLSKIINIPDYTR